MKRLGLILGLSASISCFAQSEDQIIASMFSSAPPPFCETGSSRQPVTIGGKCTEEGCEFDWGGLFSSFSYLRAEVAPYRLVNSSVTLKGDGEYGADAGNQIHFFWGTEGYLGSDKASYEGNAYLPHQMSRRGVHDFWVMRWTIHSVPVNQPDPSEEYFAEQYFMQYGEDYPKYPDEDQLQAFGSYAGDYLCSKLQVVVQDRPALTVDTNDSGIVTIKYYIDNVYSKAVRQGVIPVIKLTQEGTGSYYRDEVPAINRYGRKVRETSANITISRDSSGRYWGTHKIALQAGIFDMRKKIKAEIYDGTHRVSKLFEGTHYTPPVNNQTGGCTWSSTPSYGSGMGGSTYYEYPPIGECHYRLKIVETFPDGTKKVTYR